MGAGRSGSTALSVFLGAAKSAIQVGELTQLNHGNLAVSQCSCGSLLSDCICWSQISCLKSLEQETQERARTLEKHINIFKYFFAYKLPSCYQNFHEELFSEILQHCDQERVIDSSKYIGRALALNKCDNLDVKYIYLVRDPRGVIHSFAKNVQTSRGLMSACIYYNLVNFTAEIISRTLLKNKVLKVKYEDLLNDPKSVFQNIANFTDLDCISILTKIQTEQFFDIGHIIGGNRLAKKASIQFQSHDGWCDELPLFKRWIGYFLTFPLNLLNRYKL